MKGLGRVFVGRYPLFVRRDIDAFFGLFIDNLVNMLIIAITCTVLFNMPGWVVYGRIIPGAAVALIIGNFYYAYMAKKLAKKEKRTDVTALPYGICTPVMFVYLFMIIGPVYWATGDPILAWKVAVVAALLGGLLEIAGSWIGPTVRRLTPRAAILGTLAGIAITWIAMKPTVEIFQFPHVGFLPLAIILVGFVARVVYPGRMPAGFLAIVAGSILAWSIGFMDWGAVEVAAGELAFRPPIPAIGAIIDGFKEVIPYLVVIVPMAVYNFLETMQNVESASAAGDDYSTKEAMVVDGTGTTVGALFGGCFPTTVYIGHPGWKAVGGRMGYSVLNGVVCTIIAVTGMLALMGALIPKVVVLCILLYIGLVITAQAFTTIPKTHAAACALAFVPHIAAFTKTHVDKAFRAAGTTAAEVGEAALGGVGLLYEGFASLGYGAIVTGMVIAAFAALMIDRRFLAAGLYAAIGGTLLSFFGVIHAAEMGWAAAPYHALGYLTIAVLCILLWAYEKLAHKKLKVSEM